MADESLQRTGSRRDFVILTLAIILVAVAIGGLYYFQSTSSTHQTWLQLVRIVNDSVGAVAKSGSDVAYGVTPDFRLISDRSSEFDETIKALRDGDPETDVKRMPSGVQPEVAAVAQSWDKMRASINTVIEAETAYNQVAGGVGGLNDAAIAINAAYEQTAQRLARGSGVVAYLATLQVARLERIQNIAKRILSTGRDARAIAAELETEVKAFTRDHKTLADAGAIDAVTAKAMAENFEAISSGTTTISQAAPTVDEMETAAAILRGQSADVIAAGKSLEQALLDTLKLPNALPVISLSSGILSLILLALFIYSSFAGVRSRQKEAEDRDARQQQAILGLLDEITNLADGDLTVDVTVTEDFTGAIADSINYTVGNLRNLVGTINSSAGEIANSAGATQNIARTMSEASERQAREITAVANTITATSQSLQQVAQRAEQLAQQAQGSVEIAHTGSGTVGRTIQGMAALREQIQDTSKRIKRLGESSQEIGNIIEFINDISEQTNTLALNASIQAAMAGESGRGFAVVADEVQRLAERAATATRQIENLVKTIQADTNEAIVSMERSTANVVGGAKSAEEAGQALTKIESSSQELARLITEISASARNQSAAATKIAGTMQVIRDIAVQTSGSAGQTAKAVGELSTLSDKLRDSVSGFKLPESSGA